MNAAEALNMDHAPCYRKNKSRAAITDIHKLRDPCSGTAIVLTYIDGHGVAGYDRMYDVSRAHCKWIVAADDGMYDCNYDQFVSGLFVRMTELYYLIANREMTELIRIIASDCIYCRD